MATSQTDTFVDGDARLCSICFEKFKTPRYLPCKHSFCHDCLHSYIVSQCKSTEPRLGFHCPLCRVYIPTHGDPEKPEGWAGLYPVNDVVQKLAQGPDEKLCEPCLRENEKEESSDFCLSCNEYLCVLCAKCHRRSMASRDHIISKISEILAMQIVPKKGFSHGCPNHRHEKVQLYCHDHEKPCCGLCGGTEHRKCKRVDTIENAECILRDSGQLNSLFREVDIFEKKLLKVKKEELINVSEIESTVDENVAKTEEEASALVQRIEQLKTEHINELCFTLKKGREKLQREIEKLEDGAFCVKDCKEEIEKAQGSKHSTDMIMKFYRAKEKFLKIKQVNFRRISVNISAMKEPKWMEITELKEIANVKLAESSLDFDFDIRAYELSKFKEFSFNDGTSYCGLFLSTGRFLIVNHVKNGTCLVYDEHWDCIHEIHGLQKPYDAVQCEEDIFVTNTESKTVDVFSSRNFHKQRRFQLDDSVYGITHWNNNMYVACGKHILKLDIQGKVVRKYKLIGSNNLNIAASNSGLIVYTEWNLETVTAMTDEGILVWNYQHFDLKRPMELDVDSNDSIYVAASFSNNIHVLSSSGKLIRIIDNILRPTFFKIDKAERIVCVCSGPNTILLFQLEPIYS